MSGTRGRREQLVDVRDSGRAVVAGARVWSGPIFAVDDERLVLSEGQELVRRQTVVHHNAVNVVAWREGEDSAQARAGRPSADPPRPRRAVPPKSPTAWPAPGDGTGAP